MRQRRRFSIRLRWALPVGAVVAAGAVLAGTVLASAAAPSLPRRTPAQLLAAMQHAKLPAAMSATVSETANLGFPALPDIGGLSSSPMSAASLLAGTHTIQIWYAGPRHVRIALPVSFGETDLRVNGSQVWLWDSQGQTATHYVLPTAQGPASRRPDCMLRRVETSGSAPPGCKLLPRRLNPAPGTHEADPFAGLSPLQAAKRLLAMVGPTTKVTVPGTAEVAGRPAYQLAIAPRSDQSLVGRILIAVDAKTHLPLSVQVFARGSSSPAFQIGFTSLTLGTPAMSNFTFTPPAGAKVKTSKLPANPPGFMSGTGGMPGMKSSVRPGGPGFPQGHGPLAGAQTFGKGWLTVAAFPADQAMARAGQGAGVLSALIKAATPVHGAWGSGRLLRTSLVSVLLTSKGQVLVGAVTPAVLYADAAKVK